MILKIVSRTFWEQEKVHILSFVSGFRQSKENSKGSEKTETRFGIWRALEAGGLSVLEFLKARSVKMFMDMDIFRNHSLFPYVNTFFCSNNLYDCWHCEYKCFIPLLHVCPCNQHHSGVLRYVIMEFPYSAL